MKYIPIKTTTAAIEHAVDTLSLHLRSGEHVAWFLSGGSAVEPQVRIAQALQTHDISRLQVYLMDERYGPVGHKDENFELLMNAHFPLFISRILTGESAEKTAKTFGLAVEQALKSADFTLGIFGIGADGHTAGIKPHSPSVTSRETATFYSWDDYDRITITPSTIRRFNEAILYAVGSEKAPTLRALLHTDAPIADQPAQVLKTIKTSTLYTDVAL